MQKKRLLRRVQAAAMGFILAITPLSVVAEETGKTQSEQVYDFADLSSETAAVSDLSNPVHHCDEEGRDKDTSDYSYVYFGSYPQTEIKDSSVIAQIDSALSGSGDVWINGTKYRKVNDKDSNGTHVNPSLSYHYFKWERIKWKVLKIDGNEALLLSVSALDCQEYNEAYESVNWQNCSLRKWLNGYDGFVDQDRNGGTSFTTGDFYTTAFAKDEQNLIDEKKTGDKVFVLTEADAKNTAYGFCDNAYICTSTRWAVASDYSEAMGTSRWEVTGFKTPYLWWLRSDSAAIMAPSIRHYGQTESMYVHVATGAVVPALYLNLDSEIWYTSDDHTSGLGGGEINNTPRQPSNPSGGDAKDPTQNDPQKEQQTSKPDQTSQETVSAPAQVTIKSAKNNKKGTVTIKLKTGKSDFKVDGYEVVSATSKKKLSKVKKAKTFTKASIKLTKLKKGKTYYVKLRAYRLDGTKKVYGDWSSVKKINVKK